VKHSKRYYSFIDLAPFDRVWKELNLDDDEHAALEDEILTDPERFPVMRGTDGLRKMRFAPRSWNTGKSGALRVLYVVFAIHGTVLLVTAYTKSEKVNLTAAEKQTINDLIGRSEQILASGVHKK
jgi:hypothetical protein